jgi:PTS system nitrogen regulatory IIA component
MVKIYPYLKTKLVIFLEVSSRDEAIDRMVDAIYAAGQVSDKEIFHRSILEREKIVSTGIGMGVAIPHAKLAGYEDFFIAIGILQKGIDWHAMDGTPVRLIFMIGGPDDKQTEYLQLLSSLTLVIKDEERRKALLTEKSAEKIIDLFKV